MKRGVIELCRGGKEKKRGGRKTDELHASFWWIFWRGKASARVEKAFWWSQSSLNFEELENSGDFLKFETFKANFYKIFQPFFRFSLSPPCLLSFQNIISSRKKPPALKTPMKTFRFVLSKEAANFWESKLQVSKQIAFDKLMGGKK